MVTYFEEQNRKQEAWEIRFVLSIILETIDTL